jgi:hypothetical protein
MHQIHYTHGRLLYVLSLQVPRKVKERCQTKRCPRPSVAEESERHQRVLCPSFPPDEDRQAAHADDNHRDDVPRLPLVRGAAGDRQGHQDQCEDGDDEDDADNVELPEECDDEAAEPKLLVRRGMLDESALTRRLAMAEPQCAEEGDGADRVDDGPHADAPVPICYAQNGGRDVAGDPGVDLDVNKNQR